MTHTGWTTEYQEYITGLIAWHGAEVLTGSLLGRTVSHTDIATATALRYAESV